MALAACEKLSASPEQASESAPQCVRDADCTLVPSSLTCCADCAPAPPFEAAPVWVVDGMYIENDDRCLAPEISCGEVECPLVPPGCTAHAVCSDGRCTPVTAGCEIPSS